MRKIILLAIPVATVAGVLYFQPPLPQDPAYHLFVDNRSLYGIPNFWNVVSNALIILVAVFGLASSASMGSSHTYAYLRREFGVLFTAALLTGIGSVWYHLHPTTESLVWDRLPLSVFFTALLGLVISIYLSRITGKLLFWPLILGGLGSVLYWYKTEQLGVGDLRFYALAQYLSAFLILFIVMIYHKTGRPSVLLVLSFIMYVCAKVAEHYDAALYGITGSLSGHSMKHLLGGIALFMLYLILRKKHA